VDNSLDMCVLGRDMGAPSPVRTSRVLVAVLLIVAYCLLWCRCHVSRCVPSTSHCTARSILTASASASARPTYM